MCYNIRAVGKKPTDKNTYLKGEKIMNTNKITKAMRFEEMKNIFTEMNRADLVAFCEHEMELLAKKNFLGSDDEGVRNCSLDISRILLHKHLASGTDECNPSKG